MTAAVSHLLQQQYKFQLSFLRIVAHERAVKRLARTISSREPRRCKVTLPPTKVSFKPLLAHICPEIVQLTMLASLKQHPLLPHRILFLRERNVKIIDTSIHHSHHIPM